MAEPKSTLWDLKPHTRAKHEVLRRYLNAWFPVLGTRNGRILFIDGFAGPGEYSGGEPGSPAIAIDAYSQHRAVGKITAEVVFWFIEEDRRRAAHLRSVCERMKPSLPTGSSIEVAHGTFDEQLSVVLDQLEAEHSRLAPSFVMVDPFGVSGMPMDVMARILRNRRCEVYVSFMYESINRFMTRPEFQKPLDALFGCEQWRKAQQLRDPTERKRYLYLLYRAQLKLAGATHVVHYDLWEGNRLIYAIFFATGSTKGCDLMKQAIWKVAPFGNYAFRGSDPAQPPLGLANTDLAPLRESIAAKFAGADWVAVDRVEEFVASDESEYHTGQLKKGALKVMERDGVIEVDATSRARRFTYPSGTRLRIKRQ